MRYRIEYADGRCCNFVKQQKRFVGLAESTER